MEGEQSKARKEVHDDAARHLETTESTYLLLSVAKVSQGFLVQLKRQDKEAFSTSLQNKESQK